MALWKPLDRWSNSWLYCRERNSVKPRFQNCKKTSLRGDRWVRSFRLDSVWLILERHKYCDVKYWQSYHGPTIKAIQNRFDRINHYSVLLQNRSSSTNFKENSGIQHYLFNLADPKRWVHKLSPTTALSIRSRPCSTHLRLINPHKDYLFWAFPRPQETIFPAISKDEPPIFQINHWYSYRACNLGANLRKVNWFDFVEHDHPSCELIIWTGITF